MGSKSSAAPDMSYQIKIAEMQQQTAMEQMQLQREQMDYYKTRQDDLDRTTQEMYAKQMGIMDENQAQGREMYQYYKDTFQPIEKSLAAEAMRESTPEYYEQYVREAMATQAASNQNAKAQMDRTMIGMGVNPNSGAYASQMRALQQGNAAGMGAVANNSRERADALSWAKRAEVAGLGKGVQGAGNAAYDLASKSGTAGLGGVLDGNGQAAAAMGRPSEYGSIGANLLNGAANTYGQMASIQAQYDNANSGGFDLLGTAGMVVGAIYGGPAGAAAGKAAGSAIGGAISGGKSSGGYTNYGVKY